MKGLTYFGVLIGLSIIFCGIVPFMFLPSFDAAMALPVISVPGEVLIEDFPIIGEFTNTMVGALLADVVLLLVVLPVTMNLKRIPGRLQMFIELLFGALRGLANSVAGPKNGARLVPLAATIFFFLLFANWLELIPGVDSIGLIHCAHEDMPGFETKDGPLGMRQIVVPEPLYKGVDDGAPATEEAYEACKAHHDGEESPDHAEGGAAVATEGSEAASTEETGTGGEGEENTEAAAATTEGEGGEAHAEGETKYKEIVTPFIRAAATDLNLTFALAVIAVVVIQYMGVSELGWGYPAKFINTPALEKGDVMSFGVGWLELISEISKIISFAFRLFGNIFAGQILLFVIPFLVATMLPTAVYGLEIAVHVIQATVFAMLFMVFASIAMAGHGDEHEHH